MGIITNILSIAINVATVIQCASFLGKEQPKDYFKFWTKTIWPMLLKSIVLVAFIYLALFFLPSYLSWVLIFISPFLALLFYPVISGEKTFFNGI